MVAKVSSSGDSLGVTMVVRLPPVPPVAANTPKP
jgi:hypothetical protein